MPLPPADPSRRSRLNAVKLAALVRDHGDAAAAVAQPAEFGAGAALVLDERAWLLFDGLPAAPLGAALAWAAPRGIAQLDIVVDDAALAGRVARRAQHVTVPVVVWRADGRALVLATPAPLPEPPPVDARCAGFESLIVEAGAEPMVEHGVLAGEVDGLEVCRAVVDADSGAARLDVGVGAHDREAFRLLHGDRPTIEALRDVVAYVRRHRGGPQPGHALDRLAAERRLRHRLLREPVAAGARALTVLAPPEPRRNVKDPAPCFAVGTDGDGAPVVMAMAVGIDLELPLAGAEARAAFEPGARLVLAVPARDVVAPLARVAAAIRGGAEVRGVQP